MNFYKISIRNAFLLGYYTINKRKDNTLAFPGTYKTIASKAAAL